MILVKTVEFIGDITLVDEKTILVQLYEFHLNIKMKFLEENFKIQFWSHYFDRIFFNLRNNQETYLGRSKLDEHIYRINKPKPNWERSGGQVWSVWTAYINQNYVPENRRRKNAWSKLCFCCFLLSKVSQTFFYEIYKLTSRDAERCMSQLQNQQWFGHELKLGWGKAIPNILQQPPIHMPERKESSFAWLSRKLGLTPTQFTDELSSINFFFTFRYNYLLLYGLLYIKSNSLNFSLEGFVLV